MKIDCHKFVGNATRQLEPSTTPHEEEWLRLADWVAISEVRRLSTTPHEEEWLRPQYFDSSIDCVLFQPLPMKKNGCDLDQPPGS